jgi:sigma-B regulation protein RsbU (phosphoserine phosphatase)
LIRKVRFPLKYKFVVVITTLLLLTMGFYLNYALNIFKEDKAADVYSITLTNSISVAERAKLLMGEDSQFLFDLKGIEDKTLLGKKIAETISLHDGILGMGCLINNQDFLNIKNGRKLEQLNSAAAATETDDAATQSLLKNLASGETRLEMSLVKNFPPHYSLLKSVDKNLKCVVHQSFEKLMPLMNETLNYGTYLLTDNGKIFFKLNNISESKDLSQIVKDPTIMDIQQGVKKFTLNGNAIIRAFSKVPGLGLIAITEIEENKAFLASRELIQKSLYFGILILSVAVIAGILFTKRMTKNVQTLFLATTEVAAGNFDVNPIAEGSDEIGALTDSFVDMKDKIVKFMQEMKEKARLENELKVAHLVQHSFFPKHAVIKTKYSFDGHYNPASECSGDWWGFFEQNKRTTIIVCDATGHGVPAALITAAAHSCISTIKIDSEKNYVSPRAVLDKLNKVVCSLNSEILMTAFALEIDEENSRIVYSNASHMTPYLLQKIDETYSKEGVSPLQENNGKRLGESWDSNYEENAHPMTTGDRIVLFSDGLIEMTSEGKAWGQRNFLKSLFKAAPKDASGMIQSVLEDFQLHAKGEALQDDITLVCVSVDLPRPVIESPEHLEKIKADLSDQSVVISRLSNEENMSSLLPMKKLNHLIGFNTIDLGREARFVEILESKPTFNLVYYINETYKQKSWSLISNKKIPMIINDMNEMLKNDFEADLSGAINTDSLRLVSEELLSNAFYHSKGDEHPFKRGEEILLTPDKEVELLFAVNDEYVVIGVKSPSGFSSKERIISSIQRGYQEKTPLSGENGAGLGLYMVYENCSQFWVINGGQSGGQIICVFEKFNRYKQAKERITSFHYMAKEITA